MLFDSELTYLLLVHIFFYFYSLDRHYWHTRDSKLNYNTSVKIFFRIQKYFSIWNVESNLKALSAAFLLVLNSRLKGSTWETCKNVFYFTSKLFSFSRTSNFSILDIRISWRHQMPKHKTRDTFYWITWEVNTVR